MNKHFKVLFIIVLAVIAVISLVACNPGTDENGDKSSATYTVNFYVDGSVYSTKTANDIASLDLPDNPTKEGYAFVGWYLDEAGSSLFIKSSYTTTDTTVNLYAKFTAQSEGSKIDSSKTLQERWETQSALLDTVMYGTWGGETQLSSVINYKSRILEDGILMNYLDTGDGYLAFEFPNEVSEETLNELLQEDFWSYSRIPETNIYASDYLAVWSILVNDIYKVGDAYYSLDNTKIIRYVGTSISYEILPGTTKIGWEAFNKKENLASISIPNSVCEIGMRAFYYCAELTSVSIPDGVTELKDETFAGCIKLANITIPDSIISIGENVFHYFEPVPSGSDSSSGNKSTAWYNNQSDGLIYVGKVVYKYKGTMPDNTQISLRSDTKGIAGRAFANCKGLTSIEIPDSVIVIDDYMFYGCSGLISITIPDRATSIGSSAFFGCSGLTSVTIPDSVTNIHEEAFSGCSGLTSIIIPDNVTIISNHAFSGCTGLTSITIGTGVTRIGGYAFHGCSGLMSVSVDENNTVYNSEGNCLIEISSSTMILGCKNSIIPTDGSVTSIGDSAFYGCSELLLVTIPYSVTTIGEGAFYGCSGVTSITIPNSVSSIGYNAFYGCTGLTSITIGTSVTRIGGYAFYGCTSLTSVTFNTTTGWYVTQDYSATSGTSVIVTETSTNATNLKYLYSNYYWKRNS